MRNVYVTCRGEDSPSVSNTQSGQERPKKAGGFRRKIDNELNKKAEIIDKLDEQIKAYKNELDLIKTSMIKNFLIR